MQSPIKSGFLNPLFRYAFRLWNRCDQWLRRAVFLRLRVSGTVNIQFEDLRFRLFAHWDDSIVDTLFRNPLQYSEYQELILFHQLAKNPGTIIDVGANTGLYTIVAHLANKENQIVAFEPYHVNFERLIRNLKINSIDSGISLQQCAVGDQTGTTSFEVPANDQVCDVPSADLEFTRKFYRRWMQYKTIEVPQITLDQFISTAGITDVRLIKIDVENFELNVLNGALLLLRTQKPVLLVEMFVDEARTRWYEEVLKPLGYYCYLVLKEGIVRTDTLEVNPDSRNVIFSTNQTAARYLSFSEKEKTAEALGGK